MKPEITLFIFHMENLIDTHLRLKIPSPQTTQILTLNKL